MNKEILKLAIPNIVSNLSVPLLSIVDVALMGHLESAHFILAVGFGASLFNFLYWGFGFLRMGTTGLTAQAFGSRDFHETSYIFFRAIFIAVGAGLMMLLFQSPLLQLGLVLFDTDPLVEESLILYYRVRIYAAPATLSMYVIIGWFLGMQDARVPMVLTIVINTINIFGSFYFVEYVGMKADGVALGTVVAQYAGLVLGCLFLLTKHRSIVTGFKWKPVMNRAAVASFLKLNMDIIIRTLCLIFTLTFFKIQSGNIGVTIGAANIVLLEFFTIAAYGIDGFAFAAESVAGKYFGARQFKKLRSSIKLCFMWGIGLGLIFTWIFYSFGTHILQMMTNQEPVFLTAKDYLVWMIFSPVLMAIPFVWDGIYIGLTASKAMRNSMLISTVTCFLPAQLVLTAYYQNHGLWLALIIFFLARGISQTIMAKSILQNKPNSP